MISPHCAAYFIQPTNDSILTIFWFEPLWNGIFARLANVSIKQITVFVRWRYMFKWTVWLFVYLFLCTFFFNADIFVWIERVRNSKSICTNSDSSHLETWLCRSGVNRTIDSLTKSKLPSERFRGALKWALQCEIVMHLSYIDHIDWQHLLKNSKRRRTVWLDMPYLHTTGICMKFENRII